MKNTIALILCLLWLWEANAQNGLPMIAGARGAGMGNASVAFQDINSLFSNQAGLAHLDRSSFTAIGESRFSGFGIRSVGAGIGLPGKAGTFGLALQYFGIEDFNEQKVGLAYARRLMKKLSIGIQLDYLHFSIQDYGTKDLFTFEAGLQSQISKHLVLGVSVYSPVGVTIIEGEYLPTIFKLGGAYQISKKLNLSAEVEKDIDFPAELHLGLEYAIMEALTLRIGTQTNPNELSFGLGYQLKDILQFDFAATYHQFLGITPSFSVTYLWKKN